MLTHCCRYSKWRRRHWKTCKKYFWIYVLIPKMLFVFSRYALKLFCQTSGSCCTYLQPTLRLVQTCVIRTQKRSRIGSFQTPCVFWFRTKEPILLHFTRSVWTGHYVAKSFCLIWATQKCDQIGLFSNRLGDQFSYKNMPNMWWLFRLFWKT